MIAFTRESLRKRRIKEAQFHKVVAELQPGDIILVRTRFFWLSILIRWVTKSYWNHSALVLTTFEELPGYHAVLVAEAALDGIEIHRIQKFLDNSRFDIGVKRVPKLTAPERAHLTGYILSQVDSPYSLRRLAVSAYALLTGDFKHAINFINIRTFLCSSFIQKAFYFALPSDRHSRVIFLPADDAARSVEFLSPADIAASPNAEWIFNKHI